MPFEIYIYIYFNKENVWNWDLAYDNQAQKKKNLRDA